MQLALQSVGLKRTASLNASAPAPLGGRSWRRILGGVLAVAIATLGFLYYIGLLTSNFRTVREQHFYRSAQLSPDALQRAVERHQFKTVVNLRGKSRSGAWYFNQIEACHALNVDHVSIELDNETLPQPDVLRELLARYEAGPFPMLIHCRRGADRTGLAAVIFLVVVEGQTVEEARRSQLTWHQGHINIWPDANDRFLDLYQSTSGGRSLRDWILEEYPRQHSRLASN